MRRWGMFGLVAALALGCGDVEEAEEVECADTTSGGELEEGTPDELSELMAEVIAPRICQQVTGAFIGLPGEETHDGVEGGLDPSVGRWWIRRCTAEVQEGRLGVSFGGPGWTWLDRESTGFRVRQYLRFEADAQFSASLRIGYDRRTRIATVWLTPAPGVTAEVRPTGLVQAEATGIFSAMLGGILDLTGNSASSRAQATAAEEGSQRLAAQLQNGFTVTFELDSEQLDFMLGRLGRGQVPQRPWAPDGAPWLLNQRSAVWPGGVDVIGPIPADAGPTVIDIELEEGDGARVQRVCAEQMHQWLDAAWNGSGEGPVQGNLIAELRGTHAPRSVQVPEQDCDGVLVVTPIAETTQPVQLRYRVSSEEARTAAAQAAAAIAANGTQGINPSTAGAQTPTTPQQTTAPPAAFRIQIRSVSLSAQMADGSDWDMFGGDPDPYVVVTSISSGQEIHRTQATDDTREATFDRWLPGALRMDSLPIRFVVYDEDVAGDEVAGSADLEASQVQGRATDITLDLRSQGGTPRRTGTIRIRIQPQTQ